MSARITFFLGNGFDVGLGLHSRYNDFYGTYVRNYLHDQPVIQQFKQEFQDHNRIKYWGDFEEQFGKYDKPKTPADYLLCFNHFYNAFKEHLCNQDALAQELLNNNVDLQAQIAQMMYFAITSFHEHDSLENQHRILRTRLCDMLYNDNNNEYRFVVFNYTKMANRTVQLLRSHIHDLPKVLQICEPIYIHGTLESNMIMGVDNPDQISKKQFARNEHIQTQLIKHNQIAATHNYDSSRVVNSIYRSDIICIYGCSMGVTDKTWWKEIAQWLCKDPNHALFVFVYDPRENHFNQLSPPTREEYLRTYVDKFLSFSDLPIRTIFRIRNQIFIAVNHNIFTTRDIYTAINTYTNPGRTVGV